MVMPETGRTVRSSFMTCDTGTPKECSSLLSRKGNPLNQIILSAIPPFPNRSDTALVTPTTIMVGRMYVNAPVSSNMITTTDTVMCMIPLSAAAAPRNA